MCWISTRSPTIRTSQSSASTSYPTRWWPRNVRPCPKSLDARSATTTSTSARVCSTSLRSSSPTADGGIWTLPSATYGGGFRLVYAAASGGALSHNREGAGGPRQPKHSQSGLVVQGVRAGGSQAPLAPAGVPPHATHASWLNMVEIELSVLSRQCLERRIPDAEKLARKIGAWEHKRNEGGATVQWRFTASDAREKLARLYPAQP